MATKTDKKTHTKKAAPKTAATAQTTTSETTSETTLLATLQQRFAKNTARHPGVAWATVEARLLKEAGKFAALAWMEDSGGEPDVVSIDNKTGEVVFVDCAAQSPKGRRSCCYDRAARVGRKEAPPATSAQEECAAHGVELLDEAAYAALQALGEFDTTTSSWIVTPEDVRSQKGALFGDRRYGRVFTYHNGADSYYAARGFRCRLRV